MGAGAGQRRDRETGKDGDAEGQKVMQNETPRRQRDREMGRDRDVERQRQEDTEAET